MDVGSEETAVDIQQNINTPPTVPTKQKSLDMDEKEEIIKTGSDVDYVQSNQPSQPDGSTTNPESETSPPAAKPLAICRFMVRHYKLAFFLTGAAHVFFAVTTGVLFLMDYDIFPTYFGEMPLQVQDDPAFLRARAYNGMNVDRRGGQIIRYNADMTADFDHFGEFVIYLEADNVFTKEKLASTVKLHDELLAILKKDGACQLELDRQNRTVCRKDSSLFEFFEKLGQPNFTRIPEVLSIALEKRPKLRAMLGANAVVTKTEAKSEATRFVIQLSEKGNKDYMIKKMLPKLKELAENGYEGMRVHFSNSMLLSHVLLRQVEKDLKLAIGSFFFIYFFMVLQTGSFFITTLAILSILTSFLGANLLYRVVLDYKFFGIFHALSIFIILGIGADDIFVFYDTWRATGLEKHPNLEERLSACYRRASVAMLITSLTTLAAFIANANSPLLPINSFGVFCAILVTVNYLAVITFFPTVVLVYHKVVSRCKCCPCTKKNTTTSPSDQEAQKAHFMVRFFRGPFYKAVTHRLLRWVFLLTCALVLTPFVHALFDIKLATTEIQFFRKGHFFYESARLAREAFKELIKPPKMEVYILFGLKPADMSECHKTDFECTGKVIYDKAFDMNPKPCQIRLLYFACDCQCGCPSVGLTSRIISGMPQPTSWQKISNDIFFVLELCGRMHDLAGDKRLRILKAGRKRRTPVTCFISIIHNYFRWLSEDSQMFANPVNLSLPFSEVKFQPFFEEMVSLYGKVLTDNDKFYRYFETLTTFFSEDSNAYLPRRMDVMEMTIFDDDPDDTNTTLMGSKYGQRLTFAGLVVEIDLIPHLEDISSGIKLYKEWESFMAEEMKKLPPSCQGFQLAKDDLWHMFEARLAMQKSAVFGLVLGLSLSVAVISIATCNIITGLLATFTMASVTATVCGSIPLFGHKVSVIESVNLTLVVGLAVDYVVHLSEAYHQSRHYDRLSKVRDMLESRGMSVLSGACSTLGASVFMMAAQIQFFLQFGIFIFMTIGFSCFYSLCFFTPLMAIIGPQGECGSFMPILRWIKHKFIGRKPQDIDCPQCCGRGYLQVVDKNTNETKEEKGEKEEEKPGEAEKAEESKKTGDAEKAEQVDVAGEMRRALETVEEESGEVTGTLPQEE